MSAVKLKKHGNSYGFTVLSVDLKEVNFHIKDDFEMIVSRKTIKFIVVLNSTKGSEQQGSREYMVLSPESMNMNLNKVIVVPPSTKNKEWRTRVNTNFKNVSGKALCEQVRTVDKTRLKEFRGRLA